MGSRLIYLIFFEMQWEALDWGSVFLNAGSLLARCRLLQFDICEQAEMQKV